MPSIVGININNSDLSDFKKHVLLHAKNHGIEKVPSESEILELLEKHASEKEELRGYKIYYLFPKKEIWSMSPSPFYKLFNEIKRSSEETQ